MQPSDGDRHIGDQIGEHDILASGADHPEPRPRRRNRRRRLVIALATVLTLLGVATVTAVVYVESIPVPDLLALPQATTVYYADGRTVLARLGDANRRNLDYQNVNDGVRQAVVAARDPDFWSSGLSGIAREVVRMSFDLRGDSTTTRARVAVMAYKLEERYPKERILEFYLNAIPFGRNAYGVEAAAGEFFGKSARRDAPSGQRLGWAEAALLAAMIDQPDPDPNDPVASPGFDPTRGPKALENAQARWGQIRDAMVELGFLSPADAQAGFPTTVKPYSAEAANNGMERPTGLAVYHALSELRALPEFKDKARGFIENSGFSIVTTIDARAQAALEAVANETVTGSAMFEQPKNLQAAGVIVEPGTGRVLAYFGGSRGTGADFAGWFVDADGVPVGYGAHPAGETFFVHTLAAALRDGVSVRSRWDSPVAKEFSGHTIRERNRAACQPACTLADATTASLSVPMYSTTLSVGPAKVLATARDAGIDDMWESNGPRRRLVGADPGSLVPTSFGPTVGIGQYPVTVVDQANAMATYAAGGQRSPAHFVRQVRLGEQVVYGEATGQTRVLTPGQTADLTSVLSRTTAGRLPGRSSASMTGGWGLTKEATMNAHAWIVGYTTNLAMAVWVGNRGAEQLIRDRTGATIWGSGLPATIYRAAMAKAHSAMGLKAGSFPPPANTGRTDVPGSLGG